MTRIMMACVGLIGILLIFMALKPRKYLKMVKLMGWVLVVLAVYMLILALLVYEFANFWYYVDPIWCLVGGVLILWTTKGWKSE